MHISVLKDELINNLNLKEDSIIVDGTLGYAGDSSIILERIKRGFYSPSIKIVKNRI